MSNYWRAKRSPYRRPRMVTLSTEAAEGLTLLVIFLISAAAASLMGPVEQGITDTLRDALGWW